MTDGALLTLLEVQAQDTALDQLRHLLATLPARQARDDARRGVEDLVARTAAVDAERGEFARQQKRLEDEIATVESKRKNHNDRLYGGTVTNARELQDLQEEIESLGRRIGALEDDDLELMEQIEPLDAQLAALAEDRTRAAADLEAAELALTAAEAEIAVDVDRHTAERSAIAAGVPEALLAEYDKVRTGLGGIGIARLVGNQCGGCHLTLSAVEVAALRKHPDEAGHCEECGRILVP
jgi:hypothetical protein